ncbi:MAG: orotate phosphoribosyltransferase [Candidatus Kapabacteria bacterium]|nr:orotate phosphoribosyltransferase [Candidatus Kapabacteria bacterium]
MNRNELAKEIYDVAHITGEFLLRSGVISNEYFDKYQFEGRPNILNAIADALVDSVPAGIDALAALEMGGIPIATAISLKTGIPVVFVRKEAKKYGTNKLAEGMNISGKKLLIVEDVVTSGGQIIISAKELRELGAIIEKAICVIDREAGGAKNLKEANIELNPLFTMSEIKSIVAK